MLNSKKIFDLYGDILLAISELNEIIDDNGLRREAGPITASMWDKVVELGGEISNALPVDEPLEE